MKVLIQCNKFQALAAKVSKYSFIKNGFKDVEIIDVDDCEILKKYSGRKYLRNGNLTKYDLNDLQSFTLLRFIPYEIKNKGFCIIIDPDIFAVKNPFDHLDLITKEEFNIYCTKIDDKFRSEVMLINLNKKVWDFNNLIEDLFNLKIDYSELINLKFVKKINIKELNKNFNVHDKITNETIFLHTTNRITQPWKEGLDINFNNHFTKTYKLKNYIKFLLRIDYDKKVISNKFAEHPDIEVKKFVTECFKEALENGYISKKEIINSVKKKYVSEKFAHNIINAN